MAAITTRYRFIVSLFVFAILPVLAFPEIIFGRQTLYWSDLSWMHYPRHIFAAAEWLAGRPPLWDPYQHTGLPFLAESQVGALYLPSALFLSPLAPSLELSIYILLHFTLAATFTLMLARLLGLDWTPATVAGLSYGFGGFLMAQVPNLNIMTGAVWLPLILAGLIWLERRRSWLAALLAGVPLAMQIFTAQPQIVFYSLICAAGFTLYRITADFWGAQSPQRGKFGYALHTGALAGAAIVSGLMLAAPQWLATLELQQLSVRAADKGLAFLTNNSLPPLMLLNLLIPGIFGNNVIGFKGGDPFQEDFIYIGLIPLLLLFFGLAQRRRRNAPFFYWLLLGGLLLALGGYTPFYRLVIQHLPGFALFRIPARWLMVVNLSLAMLAGFGLQTLLHNGLRRAQLATIAAGGGLLAAAALLAAWIGPALAPDNRLWATFFAHGFTPHPANRLLLAGLPWLTAPGYLMLTNVAAALAVFAGFAWRKLSKTAFSTLLLALVCVDLAAAGGATLNPTQPESWWSQLTGGAQYVVDHVGEARVFPLGMGSEQAAVSNLGHYFPSVYRVRSAGGHGSSLMLEQMSTFLHQAHPVQAIQLLGVKYLLTEGAMGADVASTYPLAFSDERSYVYQNPQPLPRAFVVHQLIQAQSPAEALAYLQGTDIDPGQTVIIESTVQLPQPAPAATDDATTITAETPQHIEISVSPAAAGYLVLLDTYYPGWEATVDGQAAPVYRANRIGRAVFVPAGAHRIEFTYRPRPFRIGIWLAASNLAAMLGAAVATKRPSL